MSIIKAATYSVEMEWHKDHEPVLYVTAHGRVNLAKDAIDVIREAVRLEEESAHQHICVVYNLLDMTHLPFLGRFISAGQFPTTQRTAHIIVATGMQTIKLIATLSAVALGKRLRTVDVCDTPEQITAAVNRWLLPERTRQYQIEDL